MNLSPSSFEEQLLNAPLAPLELPLSAMLLVCCGQYQGVLWLEHQKAVCPYSAAYERAKECEVLSKPLSINEQTLHWYKQLQLGLVQSAVPLMVLSDRLLFEVSNAHYGAGSTMCYEPSFQTLEPELIKHIDQKERTHRRIKVHLPHQTARVRQSEPAKEPVVDWRLVHTLAPYCDPLPVQVQQLIAKNALVQKGQSTEVTGHLTTEGMGRESMEKKWFLDTSLGTPFLVRTLRIEARYSTHNVKAFLKKLLDVSVMNLEKIESMEAFPVHLIAGSVEKTMMMPVPGTALQVGFTLISSKEYRSDPSGFIYAAMQDMVNVKSSWQQYLPNAQLVESHIEKSLLKKVTRPTSEVRGRRFL